MSASYLEMALAYAKKGMPVFPLAPGAKVPTKGSHGHLDASKNDAVVRALWEPHPDANIGLATGAKSGLVVIDEDPRNGGDVGALHLPPTLTARTPSGGSHYYFRHPGAGYKVPCDSQGKRLGPGIDIKGDGGYATLPPSRVAGKPYTWVDPSVAVADLPPELWSRLVVEADAASKHGANGAPAQAGEATAHPGTGGTGTPAEDSAEPIPEGQRNGTLASLAGSMRRRGMTATEIEAALVAVNAARCIPPLPDAEVARIAQSVGRYAPTANTQHTFPDADDNGMGAEWERMGNTEQQQAGDETGNEQAPKDETSEAAGESEQTGRTYWPGVRRLSEVEETAYRWWWYPYFIRNKGNVMEGDPGVGKSLLIAELAACETLGTLMRYDTRPTWALGHPDADGQDRDPGGTVLLLAGEDDAEDTLAPRIRAAGGDLSRVIVLEKVPYEAMTRSGKTVTRLRRPTLPTDLGAILKIIRDEQCRLVIVDPITSFLDKEVSPNSDTEMRAAMDPLVDGCKRLNCTPLFVRHLNKGTMQSALHRGAGSMGIAGLARSVVMVANDPDAPEGVEQHVLGHVKSNVARKGPTLVFQKYVPIGLAGVVVPTIDWKGTSTRKPDDIYRLLAQKQAGQSSAQRQEQMGHQISQRLRSAVEWLKREFAQLPGEGLPAAVVLARGQDAGYSDKLVRTAAAYLRVSHAREGYQAPVFWYYDPSKSPDERIADEGDAADEGDPDAA
jgi:hypothetical protein